MDGGRNTVHGNDVPLEHRIDWLVRARKGEFSDHINQSDIDKYLSRGLEKMPWTEMSQAEFLQYVVSFPMELPKLIAEDVMLKVSIALMEHVVRDPERLYRSAYKVLHNKDYRSTNRTEDVTHKSTSIKGALSATEKISSIFNRRNSGSKCSSSSNEAPSSPKPMLSRNSRLGSIKKKTTPILQRKGKDNARKDSIAENEFTLHSANEACSDSNSRPNSMIIQVSVA